MAQEKVSRAGVKRESGYLYFLDADGDISRAPMVRGQGKGGKGKNEKVAKTAVKKDAGYMYFIDKDGDVARTKMARGGRKKKGK
jgi:hypothetical protein